jgi:hypothetical protein
MSFLFKHSSILLYERTPSGRSAAGTELAVLEMGHNLSKEALFY